MNDLNGMAFLKQKLAMKQRRVNARYQYYEMKNRARDFNISTPPSLMGVNQVMGWCAKSVDALADRLQYRGFQNDLFDMEAIYAANNADILIDAAILSALIGSCSFLYLSEGKDGYPRMQVVDGRDATGIIDPITNLLREGYAVLSRDKDAQVESEAWFTPEFTAIYTRGEKPVIAEHKAGHPLLVPVINRPDAKRPFGHSRISRAGMGLMDAASRTVKRSEISAEFYSFPQKWAVGVAEDLEIDKWKSAMSSMMVFTKDDEGDKPTLGQFQQQSMSPHVDQLRMFASLFAGETGLTVDDLGFVSDNPSSAEAIKASHENLRLMARKAQRDFSVGLLNAGYLAACIRDQFPYQRRAIQQTKVLWEPIFEPDASMLSSIGDGLIKLGQAAPGYLNDESIRQLTGIEGGNV